MEINSLKLNLFKITILNFKDFMKKKLRNHTLNESQIHRVHNYPINLRDSNLFSNKGFVIVDNGSQGGTHWTCFIVKDKKSNYLDFFGGQPIKFLLNQLPKPIIYHKCKIQDMNSKLCGSYCYPAKSGILQSPSCVCFFVSKISHKQLVGF